MTEAEEIINGINRNNLSEKNLIVWVNDRLEAYHKQKVGAISDEAKKHIKNVKSFKDDDIIERNVYWIEEKDFNKLLNK